MTLVFPELEPLLIARTKQAFAGRAEPYVPGLWVSSAMPKTPLGEPTRKDWMIIIRDDSGNQLDLVRENARIGVQFWGPTKEAAADLAQLGRGLITEITGGPIKRIRSGLRPIFVEDVQPMFYGTFELLVRGARL